MHVPYEVKIEELCLLDDLYFAAVMRDCLPAAEAFLHNLTGDRSVHVISSRIQEYYPNIVGRSLNCDLVILSDDGRIWIIEVQRDKRGSDPHRARYISSVSDVWNLPKNTLWDSLPDTTVVFLTASDHIGNGKRINYYPRRNLTGKDILNDGLMIEYVNCSFTDSGSSRLKTLIHDLSCKDPAQMRIPALRKRCSQIKNTKGGNLIVSELIERVYGDHLRAVEKEMEIRMRKEMETKINP